MSKGLQITLFAIGGVVVAAVLVLVGLNIGRAVAFSPDAGWERVPSVRIYPYAGSMMGSPEFDYRNSMLGPGRIGKGMMGYGMMGHFQDGLPVGGTMMGWGSLLEVEPLEIDAAHTAIESYLEGLGDDNLEIGEIMIFDNHAYAQVVERDSGVGALELLVDPVTLAVYPEHGPAMMWNIKYGHISGFGSFGMVGMMGMMRGYGFDTPMMESLEDRTATQPSIDSTDAVEIAQRYLDAYLPDAEADDAPDPFYGYWTLHIERGGEVIGMLSVNEITGQVWVHTWHGELIEIAGHD